VDDKLRDYLDQKIGGLDKYLPRHRRDGIFGSVVLDHDESLTQDRQCTCEVTLEIPGERMQAREATINMYAAIDICEAKLKSQILTYKSKLEPAKNRRQRLMAKVMGRAPLTPAEEVTTSPEA
jgi:ribosomal subunit interface protein